MFLFFSSKFDFQKRSQNQGWVMPRDHKMCINGFFAQFRPPQNPIIFWIFSKFLPNFCLQRFCGFADIALFSQFFTQKSFGSQNRQKFRKYAKNNWILQGSNFDKESVHGRYMNPRDILSIISQGDNRYFSLLLLCVSLVR